MELKDKLGPINWQFMPTKKFDPDDFEAFLKLLPTSVEGRPDPPRGRGAPRELPRRPTSSRCCATTASRSCWRPIRDYPADRRCRPRPSSMPGSWARARRAHGYSAGELDAWAERARALGRRRRRRGSRRSSPPRTPSAARRLPLRDQRPQDAQPGRRDGADRARRLGSGDLIRIGALADTRRRTS